MDDGIVVEGNYPLLKRATTGLFSLDMALSGRSDMGMPLRSLVEIYGYPGSGKSTLCYYLLGKLTQEERIAVCDFENLDREYIVSCLKSSGFRGTVKLVDTVEKEKPRKHEAMLDDGLISLESKHGGLLIDSVGAIQPTAEREGDLGQANMGKRAKLVAQLARAAANIVRDSDTPKMAYVINHVHQIIGGQGHTTAGGVTLTYMAAVRIMVWTKETFYKGDDDDTDKVPMGFLVEGKTEKLRFGPKGKRFNYYIVPGFGVHVGASAMFDCFSYGLAERGAHVKMDGKSMGYLKKDLLSYAAEGKTRKFDVFVDRLEKYKEEIKWNPITEEVGNEDESADAEQSKRKKKDKGG